MTDEFRHTELRGQALLRDPLLNKGTAFTPAERETLDLLGLLPPACNDQGQQARRVFAAIDAIEAPLDRYRELTALQDRNEHLYYRLLQDHLEALMPIVYTPTVGLATQNFSGVFQRGRGVWITPADRGRIRRGLQNGAAGRRIRLAVVTDNESILGIGDQGAGGMAIAIGKLSLYTAAAGIDPAATLPVSLDVGTDNEALRDDPAYLGWCSPRMRGEPYLELLEEFVGAFSDLFPGALLQWEDFRKDNALAILDRYRDRVLSFNDDIQGTGAVTLAGLLTALRVVEAPLTAQRILILGAGAAGLGIARQIGAALRLAGVADSDRHRHLGLLDSSGLLVDDRRFRDGYKAELAWPAEAAARLGLSGESDLAETVAAFEPTVLIGTSGQAGAFSEAIVRRMTEAVERPVILPLSNPTDNAEATPADLLAWTEGRALIAAGSPFGPVQLGDRRVRIGQGNNVFVFPALGLGALLAGARRITDAMITRAAEALAEEVSAAELASGLLYPEVSRLGEVTRRCALAVYRQACADGVATAPAAEDDEALLRRAQWTPAYPLYV